MANFNLIYPTIQKYEGYYSNLPNDKGGETYAGISRLYNKNWEGWEIVDSYKIKFQNNIIPYNYKIPNSLLEQQVKQLTYKYFLRSGASQINNDSIAAIVTHLHFNSGDGIKYVVQKAVNLTGGNIYPDNVLGPVSIKAINSADQKTLYEKIKQLYIEYYTVLGNKEPEFKTGWLNRANYVINVSDQWFNTNKNNIGIILIIISIIAIIK